MQGAEQMRADARAVTVGMANEALQAKLADARGLLAAAR